MADLHRALELEKNEAYAVEVREALTKIAAESVAKVSTPPPLIAERRIALVVGNSAYTAVPTLPNPDLSRATFVRQPFNDCPTAI